MHRGRASAARNHHKLAVFREDLYTVPHALNGDPPYSGTVPTSPLNRGRFAKALDTKLYWGSFHTSWPCADSVGRVSSAPGWVHPRTAGRVQGFMAGRRRSVGIGRPTLMPRGSKGESPCQRLGDVGDGGDGAATSSLGSGGRGFSAGGSGRAKVRTTTSASRPRKMTGWLRVPGRQMGWRRQVQHPQGWGWVFQSGRRGEEEEELRRGRAAVWTPGPTAGPNRGGAAAGDGEEERGRSA